MDRPRIKESFKHRKLAWVAGIFVAGRHAEITRVNGRTILRRVGGLRPVRVGGRNVKEVELKDNDEIQIGAESFVFQE